MKITEINVLPNKELSLIEEWILADRDLLTMEDLKCLLEDRER